MKINTICYLLLTFIFFLFNSTFYAQEEKIGFGTDNPEATCHINGNLRIREPNPIDKKEKIKDNYYPLYWNSETHEVVTREIEIPYLKGTIKYTNGNPATSLNLDPEKYELLVLGVSISNSENLSEKQKKEYSVVVKNTNNNGMPIQSFYLNKEKGRYTFHAEFLNAGGSGLYYYDGNNIIEPGIGQEPIWEAYFIAIDKNYIYRLFEITVDYETYWECDTCGGRYGIELGKYFNEELENLNTISTEPIRKTVTAKENTDIE